METFKKKDLLTLSDNLRKLSNLKGVKFSYAIAKNAVIVEREIVAIRESLKSSDKFEEYEKERFELAKKHSEKDEKGKSKTTLDGKREVFVMEDKIKFDKAFEELKAKHKVVLDNRKKQIEEYNEFLDTKADIEFFKIKLSEVPEDISVEQMQGIQLLIEDAK